MNEIAEPAGGDLALRQDRTISIGEGPGAVLTAVVQLARDPSVDAAKVEAFLRMQERMEDREAERLFNQAFVRLSSRMPQVEKLGTVQLKRKDGTDGGSYKFAKWEDMDRILRPLLIEFGFALTFDSEPRPNEGGGLIVTGHLIHEAGHSRSATISLALDTGAGRNNLQAGGSTLSYGKRYVAEMLLNIVRKGDDDDGKLGGTRFISGEQCRQIEDLIELTKSDRVSFLRHFAVEDVTELEEAAFVPAMSMLNTKKARMVRAGDR